MYLVTSYDFMTKKLLLPDLLVYVTQFKCGQLSNYMEWKKTEFPSSTLGYG